VKKIEKKMDDVLALRLENKRAQFFIVRIFVKRATGLYFNKIILSYLILRVYESGIFSFRNSKRSLHLVKFLFNNNKYFSKVFLEKAVANGINMLDIFPGNPFNVAFIYLL
jgi:hypothetical protein